MCCNQEAFYFLFFFLRTYYDRGRNYLKTILVARAVNLGVLTYTFQLSATAIIDFSISSGVPNSIMVFVCVCIWACVFEWHNFIKFFFRERIKNSFTIKIKNPYDIHSFRKFTAQTRVRKVDGVLFYIFPVLFGKSEIKYLITSNVRCKTKIFFFLFKPLVYLGKRDLCRPLALSISI